MAQPQKNLTRNWNHERLTERTNGLGLLWFDWILANDLTWQNFWKILSEFETKRRTRFFFSWWILTWRQRQTRQKTLIWTIWEEILSPLSEVLAEFDVAEDPGRLKNQKKMTIWLELRCGGPVTRKSTEDDNLAWLLLRLSTFDVAIDPWHDHFHFSKNFGQFDKKIAPKKVRIAVEIKTTGKEINPARFWGEIDRFSHSFSRYTPLLNDPWRKKSHTCLKFRSQERTYHRRRKKTSPHGIQ